MVVFRFRLSEEEYFRYNYFTAWADPRRKRFRALYFFRVILLYAIVAFLYILAAQPRHAWMDISVFLITGIGYLLLIPWFIRRSVHRRVREILSKDENRHVLEDAEIILSEDGIVDRDTASETRYRWDEIVHWAVTKHGYYLYTNPYHAIVIPLRAMDEGDKQRLTEDLLQRHLPLQA